MLVIFRCQRWVLVSLADCLDRCWRFVAVGLVRLLMGGNKNALVCSLFVTHQTINKKDKS